MDAELNTAVSRLRDAINQLCVQFYRGADRQPRYFHTVANSDVMDRLVDLKLGVSQEQSDPDRVAQAMARVDEAMKVAQEVVKSGRLGGWIRNLLRRVGNN